MQASLLSLFSEVSRSHVSPSPATQELWCFVCLESSVFIGSISPSVRFCNHDFQHQLTFLLPFLVARHQDYCLLSAAVGLCDTPLLMLQSNSDQAEKHLSLHIIFFLIECTGVYLDRILQGQFVIPCSLSPPAFFVDFRLRNSSSAFCPSNSSKSLSKHL